MAEVVQVANAAMRLGSLTPTFGVVGPLARGRLVALEGRFVGDNGTNWVFAAGRFSWGMALCGGPETTQVNFNSGVSLLQRGIRDPSLGVHPVVSWDFARVAILARFRLPLMVEILGGSLYVILGGIATADTIVYGVLVSVVVEKLESGEVGVADERS